MYMGLLAKLVSPPPPFLCMCPRYKLSCVYLYVESIVCVCVVYSCFLLDDQGNLLYHELLLTEEYEDLLDEPIFLATLPASIEAKVVSISTSCSYIHLYVHGNQH